MEKKKERSRLVEHLLKKGMVTRSQLDKAKEGIRTDCEAYSLVSMGVLSDLKLLGCAIDMEQVPYIVLPNYSVEPDVLKLIPEEHCRLNCMLPLDKVENILTLAMVDPLDDAARNKVEKMTGLTTKAVLCSARDFVDVTRTVWLEAAGKKK